MSLFEQHTIDSGLPGRHLLITAGVHGDEFEPMIAAHRLVNVARGIITKGKLTVVPVLNVSAYQLGDRCGEDNLDLARICPGNDPGTISEKVAYNISNLIRSADYYIDLHNGGKLFDIFPLAGYMLHRNEEVLDKQRSMANAFSLPVVWGTDSAPNGRTLSVARDANIPAIYVEYGGGGFNGEIIQVLVDGCINVMVSLGLCDVAAKRKTHAEYIVEDEAKDAGHLQVKMPSPSNGIFVPVIKLGDRVNRGDLWGYVCDPATAMETEVFADRSGIVLFIRVFPKVLIGESLGGILVTA